MLRIDRCKVPCSGKQGNTGKIGNPGNGVSEFLVRLLGDPSLKNNDPHKIYRDTP